MLRIGNDLVQRRGDPKGALQLFGVALGIFREFGDRLNELRALKDMGVAFQDQGKYAEAEKRYEETLVIAEEIGARREAAAAYNNLGSLRHLIGDLRRAQARYQQALGVYTELGEKRLTAVLLTNLGEVLLARGDLKGSRDSHEEALGMNRELGDASGSAYDTYRIAEVLVQTGDLRAAEERYRSSIKEQTEPALAAETRVRLAALLNDTGRAAEGEKEAREAEEPLRVQGALDLALWAQVVIADAERAQGRVKEADATLAKALPKVDTSADSRVKLSALLAEARIAAAEPKSPGIDRVARGLEAARLAAAKGGRVVDEFELRLAAAELGMAAGTPGAGARLLKVAAEARAKGLEGIARKAEARPR